MKLTGIGFLGLVGLFLAGAFVGAQWMNERAVQDVTEAEFIVDDPDRAARIVAATDGRRPSLREELPPRSAETRRITQTEPEPSDILPAPETAVGLGWGWNAFHSEAIPSVCVEFTETRPYQGQTTTLSFKEVNDSFELMQAMDMSAEGSVKTMGYEVKGEAKFASEQSVNSTHMTFVIGAEVLNAPTVAGPYKRAPEDIGLVSVRLTRNAERLAQRDVDLFKDVCGTGYISGTMGGAKLTALVSVETRTTKQKTTMSTEIEGEGWGVKVKAAMSGSSESGSSSYNREINFFQAGGVDQDLPLTEEEVLARVRELAVQATQAEKLFRISVTPYEVLENWPREVDISGDEREFEELAALWGSYQSLYADLEDAFNDPARYTVPVQVCTTEGNCTVTFLPFGEAAIGRAEDLQDDVLAVLDRLEIAARQCLMAEEDCNTDTSRFRSPYAVRVQMPIDTCLVSSVEVAEPTDGTRAICPLSDIKLKGDTSTGQSGPEKYAALMVRELAKSRCDLGSLTPGCILNDSIRKWEDRIGRQAVVFPSQDWLTAFGSHAGLEMTSGDPETVMEASLWYSADQVTTLREKLANWDVENRDELVHVFRRLGLPTDTP